jgi:predicted RNase H-like HicB family nuclease/predicted XRE-type DNA-binding protein
MKTYYATLELDPQSRQWMADIEGLPVHTWGRTLAKVKGYAQEALALHLDVSVEDVRGRLVFRTPQLPQAILDAIDDVEATRSAADTAAVKAAEAKAVAARALVRDAHLSMRDAAEVLGVSHQRVQQLLAG